MRRLTALAVAAVLTCVAGAANASTSCAVPGNADALATAIANGVNQMRRANGLRPLTYNPTLGRAAMAHACDMELNAFFDHHGSNGSNHHDRIMQAGYRDCLSAENLAWGYPDPNQIITGWMHSPGHRFNMLHPDVREMGVAVAQGSRGPIWVLELAKPCR